MPFKIPSFHEIMALAVLCFITMYCYSDKYDDAVLQAMNNEPVAEKMEPDTPSYEETLSYIQKNIKYPFNEVAHCQFLYEESEGDLLSKNRINASELLAMVGINGMQFECKRMSKCIAQDYYGFTSQVKYQTKMSSWGIYIKDYNEKRWQEFSEAMNHLIAMCGGSREY